MVSILQFSLSTAAPIDNKGRMYYSTGEFWRNETLTNFLRPRSSGLLVLVLPFLRPGPMTQSFDARLHDIVILSGATTTRTIEGAYEYSDATAITIQSPATLDAGTYVIQVSNDGTTFSNLNDGTNDIAPPAAGKSRQYIEMLGFRAWRISGPTSAANRTFLVSKQWTA